MCHWKCVSKETTGANRGNTHFQEFRKEQDGRKKGKGKSTCSLTRQRLTSLPTPSPAFAALSSARTSRQAQLLLDGGTTPSASAPHLRSPAHRCRHRCRSGRAGQAPPASASGDHLQARAAHPRSWTQRGTRLSDPQAGPPANGARSASGCPGPLATALVETQALTVHGQARWLKG